MGLVYSKVFIVTFFVDFFIRLFINPKFAPTMILGRLAVKKQEVEYSGAPQKRFAWGIGLAMSFIMLILVVFMDMRGPINFVFCVLCLFFLYCEAVFGICIGCWMYSKFSSKTAKHCPGGACKIKQKHAIQHVGNTQIGIALVFISVVTWLVISKILG